MYVKLILPLSVSSLFTYRVPKDLELEVKIGRRVVVQFGQGNKLYTGLIASTDKTKPSHETKDVLDIIDDLPIVDKVDIDFWKWMSEYYMCSIGAVMNAALPGILNISSETQLNFNKDSDLSISELPKSSGILLNIVQSQSNIKISELQKSVPEHFSLGIVRDLIDREILIPKEHIKDSYKPKIVGKITLSKLARNTSFDELVFALKNAPAQLKALMFFVEKSAWDGELFEEEYFKKLQFQDEFGVSPAVVKTLIEKDIFEIKYVEESRFDFVGGKSISALKKLNKTQHEKLDEIKLGFKTKNTVLLQGVTSSGKTEIYAHLIEKVLQSGGQALYLLPEIALTSQLIIRLSTYFGDKIGLYHSRLNANERVEVWKSVRDKKSKKFRLILGARSAVFLPFHNLKFIVVDEEHDRSFKQQNPAPRYNGRDAAIVLANLHGAKVLLGSATPSLESRFNAMNEKYGFSLLEERFGGFKMPELEVVDMIEEKRKRKNQGSLSSVLIKEMDSALASGEQVIIFQNRRGYAPFVVCENCAHTPSCINCDVTLTFHKNSNRLLCHQCGYSINMMSNCTECGSGIFVDKGIGTEKVEEEIKVLRPHLNLARFDFDSTRRKNAFQEIIADFEEKNVDVLVGTQMVTKGLDFENVGLVGIINADQMLKFPDFRSFERTFQMLTQVSGRAGRKKKRGKVVIQTYDPQHAVIQYVLNSDFDGFLKAELKERKMFKYAPYYRMIEVHLKHRDRSKVNKAAHSLGKLLKSNFGDALLGPEFPYIERLRNLYTMHFILRISKDVSIGEAKKYLLQAISSFTSHKDFKSIRVQFDVDPS